MLIGGESLMPGKLTRILAREDDRATTLGGAAKSVLSV